MDVRLSGVAIVTVISAISLVILEGWRRRRNREDHGAPPGRVWKESYDVDECPYGASGGPSLETRLRSLFTVPLRGEGGDKKIGESQDRDRSLVPAIKSLHPRGVVSSLPLRGTTREIPRVVMQTNEKDDIPKGMYAATISVIENSPTYDYVYFNNTRARDYIAKFFGGRVLRAYDELIPGAYKADLFRYCYLYREGGVYIDMGMVLLCDLDDVIFDDDRFVVPEDNGAGGLYNAFMCCAPHSEILKVAIDMAVDNIERRDYTNSPLGITGPLLLSNAFKQVTGHEINRGTEYPDGIRILSHYKPNHCASGEIHSNDRRITSTRSPTYRREQTWYNTAPRYTDLWNRGQVYRSDLEGEEGGEFRGAALVRKIQTLAEY